MASFPGENHLEEPGGAVWFRKQGKVVEVGGGGRGALGPHLYPLPRVQGSPGDSVVKNLPAKQETKV